jgi:hypothetical protein
MPLASAPDIFQGGLFVLAVRAALYGAREIVLPIVLAVMLKLLLQPALRTLQRFHVPGGAWRVAVDWRVVLYPYRVRDGVVRPGGFVGTEIAGGRATTARASKLSARAD